MLQLTAAARVGGAPLRMTVYLIGNGHEEHDLGCLAPTDSPLTPTINESAIFSGASQAGPIYGYTDGLGYVAWGELIGQLSVIYPHLVGISVDDYTHSVQAPSAIFTPAVVAKMQAAMRRHSPWLVHAPTMYLLRQAVLLTLSPFDPQTHLAEQVLLRDALRDRAGGRPLCQAQQELPMDLGEMARSAAGDRRAALHVSQLEAGDGPLQRGLAAAPRVPLAGQELLERSPVPLRRRVPSGLLRGAHCVQRPRRDR